MKSINSFTIISFFLIVFLSSCTPKMLFTSIDVLHPAEVTVPLSVNNILIVNNAIAQSPDLGHVNIVNSKTSYESLKFDSAAIFATSSLRDALSNTGYFNSVMLSPIKYNKSYDITIVKKLPKTAIKTISSLYKADAVLALDHIVVRDTIASYTGYYNDNVSVMNATVKSFWSLNFPDSTATQTFTFTDTFSWGGDEGEMLPNRYDALVDASILSGSNIAMRLLPQWEKQDRYLFESKDKLMKQAMDSFTVKNWYSAAQQWENIVKNPSHKTPKEQVYNNLAIAYELSGNVAEAYKNILTAIQIRNSGYENSVASYILVNFRNIENREKDADKLKDQLGN